MAKVTIHQGSVLSSLLFLIVFEVLSRDTHRLFMGVDANDLVLVVKSMEKLKEKFQRWKDAIDSKGFRVSILETCYI